MPSTTQIAVSLLLLCLNCVTNARTTSQSKLADLVKWSLADDNTSDNTSTGSFDESKSSDGSDETYQRQCTCNSPSCRCCVHFNLTYIDLPHPGCVSVKYLHEEESIAVNVSYGESQIHQDIIKVAESGSTPVSSRRSCMNVLTELAQMCAKLSLIERVEGGGIQSCAALEPTLLGQPQDSYHIACFLFTPNSATILPSRPVNSTDESDEPDETDDTEEAIINAVNESAEEGIAWFTSLLGLSLGNNNQSNTSSSSGTALDNDNQNAVSSTNPSSPENSS